MCSWLLKVLRSKVKGFWLLLIHGRPLALYIVSAFSFNNGGDICTKMWWLFQLCFFQPFSTLLKNNFLAFLRGSVFFLQVKFVSLLCTKLMIHSFHCIIITHFLFLHVGGKFVHGQLHGWDLLSCEWHFCNWQVP
jgi:hypothetical protein